VKKYLPYAPAARDKITIFRLLTHTSGIPNFTGFPDYAKLKPFDAATQQLIARFRDEPLDFQPAEKWSYPARGDTVGDLQGSRGPASADICEVKFENGSLECRIRLAPDGKVGSANYRRAP